MCVFCFLLNKAETQYFPVDVMLHGTIEKPQTGDSRLLDLRMPYNENLVGNIHGDSILSPVNHSKTIAEWILSCLKTFLYDCNVIFRKDTTSCLSAYGPTILIHQCIFNIQRINIDRYLLHYFYPLIIELRNNQKCKKRKWI